MLVCVCSFDDEIMHVVQGRMLNLGNMVFWTS